MPTYLFEFLADSLIISLSFFHQNPPKKKRQANQCQCMSRIEVMTIPPSILLILDGPISASRVHRKRIVRQICDLHVEDLVRRPRQHGHNIPMHKCRNQKKITFGLHKICPETLVPTTCLFFVASTLLLNRSCQSCKVGGETVLCGC